jgi:hypothetical protein
MANWTDTRWEVILPTENVDTFLRGFLWESYSLLDPEVVERFGDNDTKQQYVLTFVYFDTLYIEEYKQGLMRVEFNSTCKWSFRTSALMAFNNDDGTKQMCIADWCEENDVRFLDVISDELGMSFRETFYYDKENGVDFVYDCRDIDYFNCDNCSTYGVWEDYDLDLDRSICPECGCKFEEDDE